MKRVTAIVRPEKMEPLKDALFAADEMCIRDSHGTDDRVSRDARRKDALLLAGYDLVTMTGSQLGNVFQCAELLDQLSARMGKPKKKRGAGHLDRHMRLRKQLRSYHNSFLFRDGKGSDR